ncbi:MAG: Cerebroside-sulfatase [Verrucomicrobiales bacterium]|nr:Cerebroside-sulfatase [Verrucomicrobiales bacterium]|tara:strand:+ start:139 stop:1536 length:1398 start_codon:yes stop_codon:yes gene_type:complete
MIRSILIWLAFAGGLLAADKPNIIFIFADDLGYGDLGCYGHPYAQTPVLDQLAKDGTRFTQAYVTGVTCCPSRTGAMTGRHPARFAKYMASHGFGDAVTITELLKRNGYRTGHFGKWHIGPETEPGTYGIDVINDHGKEVRNTKSNRGRDAHLVDGAIAFLKANAGKGKPLYLNVWGHITHFPVKPLPKFAPRFANVKVDASDFGPEMKTKFAQCRELGGDINVGMRHYLADVYSMDLGIGRLLKTVDDLGMRESTIVVFSSDHGPAPVVLTNERNKSPDRIEFARNMLGSPGPFRGGKHTQWEGGVRTPFIIRWPGQVPAGRVNSTSVISFMDWLPTLCKITGTKNTATKLDGEDVSDIWLGAKRTRKTPLFWRNSSPGGMVSLRAGDWKFHANRKQAGGLQLYDLAKDPAESRNLVDEQPKLAHLLQRQAAAWAATLPTEYDKIEKPKKKGRPKRPRREHAKP